MGADSIDPAFHRRLTATIRFRLPDERARAALWRSVWPTVAANGTPLEVVVDGAPLANSPVLERLARDHALSGGSIANIARNAAFLAVEADVEVAVVGHDDLEPRTDGDGERVRVAIDGEAVAEAVRLELTKIGDFRSLMRPRVAATP